jgi:putative SOS response-associated peptidase YedK
MDTFAVITVEPNELVERTTHHDRMPLVVKRSHWQRWLEPCDPQQPFATTIRLGTHESMASRRSYQQCSNTGPELGASMNNYREDQNLFD